MRHLIVDFHNALHRARVIWGKSPELTPQMVAYNFFRALKSSIDLTLPDRVLLVGEGQPKHRLALDPDYKGTRDYSLSPPRLAFLGGKELVQQILPHLAVQVLHHPDFEADDTIANLCWQILEKNPRDVIHLISSDSDFIQLLDDSKVSDSIFLYNPIKKIFVPPCEGTYLHKKSLTGDKSDNIPPVPKFSGEKSSLEMAKLPLNDIKAALAKKDPAALQRFEKNLQLVQFHRMTAAEFDTIEVVHGILNLEIVKDKFKELGFKSIVDDDKTWNKFCKTFSLGK